MSFYIQKGRLRKTSPLFGCLLFNLFLCVGWLPIDVYIFGALGILGYCAQFTDKFHENYFSYIIHIDSGLESNVSAYHRRSVPSSHAFASTLQLHKSASRCISDSS